ncbi:MAG: hypothetical protein ACLQVL_38045 [Terriglobia bacterium]
MIEKPSKYLPVKTSAVAPVAVTCGGEYGTNQGGSRGFRGAQ